MEESKPFACQSIGCSMTFTNEDHLNVHSKKHDMVLNLGTSNKNNTFVADQTPTPTRFIRSCDEVGLFEELLNPFEQTFRRAVEAKKSGECDSTTNILEANQNQDDTLHTPHIFSNDPLNDELNKTSGSSSNNINTITLKLNANPRRSKDSNKSQKSPKGMNKIIKEVLNQNHKKKPIEPLKHKKILPKLLKTQTSTVTQVINAIRIPIITENLVPIQSDICVKEKLKAVILKTPSPTIFPITTPAIKNTRLQTNKKPTSKNKKEMEPKKSSHAMASNREAAKRYRMRIQQQQEQLLEKMAQLEEDNAKLRVENEKLNRFYQNHKNCAILNSSANLQINQPLKMISCPCDDDVPYCKIELNEYECTI